MEENLSATILDGEITGIGFALANWHEICTASISDCPINHASQLCNPFLGLPLEFGKCESCGTAEPGKCEGHFGYIEMPIPIYHPCHVSELKRLLSLLCLKCLKMKKGKVQFKNHGLSERLLSSCCEDASQISINEVKPEDGACYLQLKVPSRSRLRDGFWNFLERYGYRYGDMHSRKLLASEVMEILKRIPEETRKKLSAKGYFPQDGYVLQYLPVPPNCLSVPDVSDGVTIMSSDQSVTMLKKILRQVEIIKSSRSGVPNFESHEVEANDLQLAVERYLEVRGTAKATRDMDMRFGISKESDDSSTKAWLEKMRTLFIRKGSGFSSRSVITGDAYKGVNEIGLPFEIAQRITFEEKVNLHNMKYLQELVDNKLCLTYRDGSSTYSLREGSKGHTFLRPGQVVHRRIMDGDIVFINRPPTTHKHSLQALSVYVHDDHTVKINPLICGPLSADFDGDCVHIFYPQSLAAKAEVLELFSVEKQLLSSHTDNLNLQLVTDSLLSLKMLFKMYFLDTNVAQQLATFVSASLPQPAVVKGRSSGPLWTAMQILQTALPGCFDCIEDRHKNDILKFELNSDIIPSVINEAVNSVFFEKGPMEVIEFFNSLQPLLMEYIYSVGFSVCLEDFSLPMEVIRDIKSGVQDVAPLLYHLRSIYDESVEKSVENQLRIVKEPVANFILKSPALGNLIDCKSDSAINKVVQQIGFLGLQLSDRGKFYTGLLVEDMASLFRCKYPFRADYPSAEYGLVRSCFSHGLDPYEEMVHSISSREVMVRSSRGLAEPGTLFKNLMAILRDVVICYDGTVRNVCSNSVIQFEYGVNPGTKGPSLFPAGEPVGVLAATAMSNPAYKAVLDSSPSSNNSWELMKEILLCRVNFKNDPFDRRVILYLNDCGCGRKYCPENAAYLVRNQLKKVILKDAAVAFTIEYRRAEISEIYIGLVGHVFLNKDMLDKYKISMQDIHQKCQEAINSFLKKKRVSKILKAYVKRIVLSVSEHCTFQQPSGSRGQMPCLMFYEQDSSANPLETSHILANVIYPVLLQAVIKGDPRISTVNIVWISPNTTTWIRNPCKTGKGELVLDIVVEKGAVKQSGDAWRIVLDSCLPVFHLIDSKRSIPYAIKQVQELLGVSCAFDQAVQRLATSVTMVTKGILKEHLILLANSMTCAGNLVGFNVGGYKALSRSLSLQVPFTEATLFTPKKCFERAAEKCHMDSLSSIVASCSWGKHVAVGTGSPFEVLWDKREIGSNPEESTDVYKFLYMVRNTDRDVQNTACLGAEVDDLVLDEDAELGLSPEHDPDSVKPVFEDTVDFQYSENQMPRNDIPNDSGWDRIATDNVEVNGTGDWAADKNGNWESSTSMPKPNAWSGWGSDKIKTQDNLSSRAEDSKSANWDEAETQKGPNWEQSDASENVEVNRTGDWAADKDGNWGSSTSMPKPNAWSGWGSDKIKTQNDLSSRAEDSKTAIWDKTETQKGSTNWEQSDAWGKKVVDETGWNEIDRQSESVVGARSRTWDVEVARQEPLESKTGRWQQNETPVGSWGPNNTALNEQASSQGWDSPKAGNWKENKGAPLGVEQEVSTVKEDPTKTELDQPATSHGWDSHKAGGWNESESSGWGSPKVGGWNGNTEQSQWVEQEVSTVKKDHSETELNQRAVSHGWDSPKAGGWNENESRGWGSSSAREWKGKKNRPAKPPGMFTDDSNVSGIFTATRQRFDRFTTEEQQILTDVEPIMQSIRRIMHQSGYNDGDKLSPDDQSYVLDNVFAYHPEKEAKMGAGIDSVMVDKHTKFQETRCFYIVSTDGRKEDFSSRKCIENFVQGKYPELGEAFVKKYFRNPRPGGNREQSVNPEDKSGNENGQ